MPSCAEKTVQDWFASAVPDIAEHAARFYYRGRDYESAGSCTVAQGLSSRHLRRARAARIVSVQHRTQHGLFGGQLRIRLGGRLALQQRQVELGV